MYQLYSHINHSRQWLKRSADAGYDVAQYEYGLYLIEKDSDNPFQKGVEYLQKSAEQGNEKASAYLKNNDEIIQLKLKAEKGDPSAQFNLGVKYNFGRGVAQDFKDAFKWYRKAAEQGHASSQFNLALMYKNGGRYQTKRPGSHQVVPQGCRTGPCQRTK